LKRTSAAIHEELKLQASLVDSFERDIEKTGARVRKAEQRAADLAGARSETAGRDSSSASGGSLLCAPQRSMQETTANCALQ
jgi:hypothetical protein